MKVVINGAGIAGTALAYWLNTLGHEVVLVERAPTLRTGGYLLNLWGIGYQAAEKMGVLPGLLALQYETEELAMVDRHGHTRGGYPSEVLKRLANGRIVALARADIAHAIHHLIENQVETLFGDSIASIEDSDVRTQVHFECAPAREVDLVVGADGLHSSIRQMIFGPDSQFERSMGCHVASFELEGYRPREQRRYVAHSAPGRYIARFPIRDDKALIFMLLRDEYLGSIALKNDAEHKSALSEAFHDVGWECPKILSVMQTAGSVYFDRVSQIHMDTWVKGRVVLVGDAAASPSLLAGEGAGFALAQAYVLAGEIHRSNGDLPTALMRYQRFFQSYVARKQRHAERLVSSFLPKTELGIRVRDFATRLMRLPLCSRLLMGRYFRDTLKLPDYGIQAVVHNKELA